MSAGANNIEAIDIGTGVPPIIKPACTDLNTTPSRDAQVIHYSSPSTSDAQATDALAAEVLDATDGAFPSVADAIEVGADSVTPSGFEEGSGIVSVKPASNVSDTRLSPVTNASNSHATTDGAFSSGVDAMSPATGANAIASADIVIATDVLAAEALDATDGAFLTVADAIEAANLGSGSDATVENKPVIYC